MRQGFPLLLLLYVISMEVLEANLLAYPLIEGFKFPSVPDPLPVLSLYADNTSVICTDYAT